jgi:hypothetical protein
MTHAGPASLTLLPGNEQPSWPALHDLAFLLAAEAGALAGRLSSGTAIAVGDLVRGMNCYYSNLIEATTPFRWISNAPCAPISPRNRAVATSRSSTKRRDSGKRS